MYLQDGLKDGPATCKCVSQGLTQTSQSYKEAIKCLYDVAIQHYWALKAAYNDLFDTVLTVLLHQKLDNETQLKWVEYSNNSERVQACTEFFKFLDLQVRHLESISYTGNKQAPGPDRKIPMKQFFAASTDDNA